MPPEGGDGSEYQPWSDQESEDYLQSLLQASRIALGEADPGQVCCY